MRIEVPDYDSFVEFDDDTPPETIKQVMAAHFPNIIPQTLDDYIAINSHPEGRRLLNKALKERI